MLWWCRKRVTRLKHVAVPLQGRGHAPHHLWRLFLGAGHRLLQPEQRVQHNLDVDFDARNGVNEPGRSAVAVYTLDITDVERRVRGSLGHLFYSSTNAFSARAIRGLSH